MSRVASLYGPGDIVQEPILSPHEASAEALMDMLDSAIAPESWRISGGEVGSMREFEGVLIVTQTSENQHAIAGFIAQLRAARGAATQPASRVSP